MNLGPWKLQLQGLSPDSQSLNCVAPSVLELWARFRLSSFLSNPIQTPPPCTAVLLLHLDPGCRASVPFLTFAFFFPQPGKTNRLRNKTIYSRPSTALKTTHEDAPLFVPPSLPPLPLLRQPVRASVQPPLPSLRSIQSGIFLITVTASAAERKKKQKATPDTSSCRFLPGAPAGAEDWP